MKVYIISGLGADHRAFQKLKLPPGFEPVYIEWIKPERNESLQHYTQRLSKTINTNEPFVLMGLSFGGLVAGEMAKTLQPKLTISLSTMKTSRQMSFLYKLGKALSIHKILPYRLFKKGNFLTYYAFGIKTPEDKKILTDILCDTDLRFLKWAINALLHWKNETPANKLFHLHGSKDKLIPIKKPLPDQVVQNGGHLMVLTQSEEVSGIISERLVTLQH